MAEIAKNGNVSLYIDDNVDSEEEIKVVIEYDSGAFCTGDETIWINKEHAIKIVNHLTKVFKLDNTKPDLKLPEVQGVYMVKTKD